MSFHSEIHQIKHQIAVAELVLLRMKNAFAISYADLCLDQRVAVQSVWSGAYQQMAVLGIVVIIRGFNPRKYPLYPSLW